MVEHATKMEIRGSRGTLQLKADDEPAIDLAMLIEGETSGRPLEEVLAEFGRSRTTYYEKLRRFREQGLEGLFARPPGPRGPWKRTSEVVRLIVTARLKDPSRSAEAITQDLSRAGINVSLRSVERTLSQYGLTHRVGEAAAAEGEVAPVQDSGAQPHH